MGEVLVFERPKQICFESYEERNLNSDEVLIETLYSGISAGTQLTAYRGTNPFASKKWNSELKIFETIEGDTHLYPVKGAWGYEEVGRIVKIGSGIRSVELGDIIYGTWGHKSTAIASEDFASNHILPKELDPICGIYSQMGSIALNAILDADIHVGETVAIFGQGVPGQIAAQLARLNGASVIAVDLDDRRLARSRKFGADYVINSSKCDVAKEIKLITQNKGADVSLEISGSTAALHEAIRSTVYNGRVVCSGFIQGNANGLFLGEEFHHNRINIVCSQINAVSPALSYRWNRLRMERMIMKLQIDGKINLKDLVTHVIPFKEGDKAYDMLDRTTDDCLQVVLSFQS